MSRSNASPKVIALAPAGAHGIRSITDASFSSATTALYSSSAGSFGAIAAPTAFPLLEVGEPGRVRLDIRLAAGLIRHLLRDGDEEAQHRDEPAVDEQVDLLDLRVAHLPASLSGRRLPDDQLLRRLPGLLRAG